MDPMPGPQAARARRGGPKSSAALTGPARPAAGGRHSELEIESASACGSRLTTTEFNTSLYLEARQTRDSESPERHESEAGESEPPGSARSHGPVTVRSALDSDHGRPSGPAAALEPQADQVHGRQPGLHRAGALAAAVMALRLTEPRTAR